VLPNRMCRVRVCHAMHPHTSSELYHSLRYCILIPAASDTEFALFQIHLFRS
jgi:hypothetical protein